MVTSKQVTKKGEKIDGIGAFTPTEYWKVLQPRTTAVKEPDNKKFKSPQAPTIEQQNYEFAPLKYDFGEKFYVPAFEVTKDVHLAHQKIKHKKYKYYLHILKKVRWDKLQADTKFKKNHKLTMNKAT